MDDGEKLPALAAEALARLARLAASRPSLDSSTAGASGSYILDPSIHTADADDVMDRFRRYAEYLESVRDLLPPGARSYALGPWHNCGTRECPHDSWLEEAKMQVRSSGERSQYRNLDIHVRLLGSYHDGYIEFHYTNVRESSLVAVSEWMYDEVRLGAEGRVIHEIRFDADSRWSIECEDLTCEWKPFDSAG